MIVRLRAFGSNIVTFLTALVPIFKSCPPCPMCMPKYAAILSFFGLELADYSAYLVPVMLTSMAISLSSMFYQTTKRKLGRTPFYTALTSCISLLVFKYIFDYSWGVYAAMVGLLSATVLHYRALNQNQENTCCDHHKHCI